MILPTRGQRIRLLHMPEDPDPVPAGSLGTVEWSNFVGTAFMQISVRWDNGRTLMLSIPPDEYEVVP